MKEKVKEKREVLFGGNRKDATEFDGKGFWLKISQDFFSFHPHFVSASFCPFRAAILIAFTSAYGC